MKPIKFDEATRTLGAPVGWDESRHGPCGGLPVWHGGDSYVSCWQPSWRERFAILFGTPVWLSVISIGHPPVAIHAKKSIFVPAE